MINAERSAIAKLYNHFHDYPDSFYSWINASPARTAICKGKLIRSCLLRYDTCCPLLFTLFQENAYKDDSSFQYSFKSFLNDLKKSHWTVYYCELYNNEKVIHPFIAQKTRINIQFYQSHPNTYTLYESLEHLDNSPVPFEYVRDQLSYLESGQKSYVQHSLKLLFHISPSVEGNIFLRYRRCSHVPFSNLTLPKLPSNNCFRYIAFVFFAVTAIIWVISIRHSAKCKS